MAAGATAQELNICAVRAALYLCLGRFLVDVCLFIFLQSILFSCKKIFKQISSVSFCNQVLMSKGKLALPILS